LKVTVHEAALNNFDGWSDGQKSTLLLLIAKLAQIGMLIRPIPVTLLKEPAGEFAKANWREAKKLLGLA